MTISRWHKAGRRVAHDPIGSSSVSTFRGGVRVEFLRRADERILTLQLSAPDAEKLAERLMHYAAAHRLSLFFN